jgi:hypothetical protein
VVGTIGWSRDGHGTAVGVWTPPWIGVGRWKGIPGHGTVRPRLGTRQPAGFHGSSGPRAQNTHAFRLRVWEIYVWVCRPGVGPVSTGVRFHSSDDRFCVPRASLSSSPVGYTRRRPHPNVMLQTCLFCFCSPKRTQGICAPRGYSKRGQAWQVLTDRWWLTRVTRYLASQTRPKGLGILGSECL